MINRKTFSHQKTIQSNNHSGWSFLGIVVLLFIFSFAAQAQDPNFHQNIMVADAHAHQLTFSKDEEAPQLYIEDLFGGGVDLLGLYFAYYPIKGKTLVQQVSSDLQKLRTAISSSSYPITIAASSSEIKQQLKAGKTVLYPGVEYFFGTVNNDPTVVDSLFMTGVRAITLMNNDYDKLGKNPDNEIRLTPLGEEVINRMNRKGMLIDISHLSDAMQKEVIAFSKAPVIASHSPVRGVHDSERNIPDDILKQLAEKDGAIMITFNSGSLAGKEEGRTNIQWLIKHIKHAVNVAGIDHVGIGSDFNGAGLRSPKTLEDASGFPNITRELLAAGFTETETKKIMGGNFLRILEKAEHFTDKTQ